MSTHETFSQNTGPTLNGLPTCGPFPEVPLPFQTSLLAATPAKETAQPSAAVLPHTRASAVSSSALLMNFARDLFSEKIQHSRAPMLHGLGGDSGLSLSRLVTLCCPSDCERAALGLSINGIECSCSPKMPTPVASDWKGGKRKRKPGSQANLRDEFTQRTGWLYLHPEDLEVAQGFPATWSELSESAMPSFPPSRNGSADASSNTPEASP